MSTNSGDDIYNVAIVTGQGPSGQEFFMTRGHDFGGAETFTQATNAVANTGFEADTSGWTVLWGSLTRDTTINQTGAASGRMTTDGTALEAQVRTVLTGLSPGVRYEVSVYVLKTAALSFGPNLQVELANNIRQSTTYLAGDFAVNTWTRISISFMAQQTSHGFRIRADSATATQNVLYIDNIGVERSVVTLADRRGIRRAKHLPISAALPDVAGPDDFTSQALIADTWLTGHRATPFKGIRTLLGDGAIRDLRTGQNIGLHTLGLNTMEMVRFSDQIDPDTGGLGRDGRMTKVKYNRGEDSAEITIDNSRASFEALLARLGLNTGK